MKRGQGRGVEGLHAKFPVNVFIVLASGCRKPQFLANFDFLGLMYRPLLLMRVKFGVLKQTERLHLHAKFHLNVFIVSASGGQKRQFWANFYFWGAPVLTPITDEGQLIRCATADPQHTFKCQNLSRSVYSISPSGDEAPNFCRFLGWHFVISTVGGNPRKLNMGAQLQLTLCSLSAHICAERFMPKCA